MKKYIINKKYALHRKEICVHCKSMKYGVFVFFQILKLFFKISVFFINTISFHVLYSLNFFTIKPQLIKDIVYNKGNYCYNFRKHENLPFWASHDREISDLSR